LSKPVKQIIFFNQKGAIKTTTQNFLFAWISLLYAYNAAGLTLQQYTNPPK
jgi:hypothetical protein